MFNISPLEISRQQAQKELKILTSEYKIMQQEGYYDLEIVEKILCLELTANPDITQEQWSKKVKKLLKTRRV